MADALNLRSLPNNFGEHYMFYKASLRQRIQARKFAKESYIERLQLFAGNDKEVNVKCYVLRSMKKNDSSHRVNFSIGTGIITDAICSCKAGVGGECSHVLAVVLKLTDWVLEGLTEAPSQPACTSVPQQWDKPRGARIVAEPVSTIVIAKPGNMERKKRPLIADFYDCRKIQLLDTDIQHLQSLSESPIAYLASTPDQTVMTDYGAQSVGSPLAYQLPLLQPVGPSHDSVPCADIVYPHTTVVCNNPEIEKEMIKNVSVTVDEAVRLETNTRDQSYVNIWHVERNKRITASNFGRFMKRKSAPTQTFVDSVLNAKSFSSAATSYGKSNEKVAVNMYRKKTKNHVHDCGLVVNPAFPYIGASPDGKVCEKGLAGILEVKCPFNIRDLTLQDALDEPKYASKLCVEINNEQHISLKRDHLYWFHIQGQLLVTGAKFCDFVIYTRKDMFVERILPDSHVMESILSKTCCIFKNFVYKQE